MKVKMIQLNGPNEDDVSRHARLAPFAKAGRTRVSSEDAQRNSTLFAVIWGRCRAPKLNRKTEFWLPLPQSENIAIE